MYAAKQYIQRFCTSVLFCCIHESFCVFRYFLKKKGKGDFVMALVIELFLLGVGLSMDAFAVSVCKGLGMRKLNKKQALIIGLYFGGFQALMPFVGWLLGSQFQKYITSIDHWIAFILLGFIGGHDDRSSPGMERRGSCRCHGRTDRPQKHACSRCRNQY